MGKSCLICNSTIQAEQPTKALPGPASSKKRSAAKQASNERVELSKSLSVTFCKALNIPEDDFKKELINSPACKDCSKRIQNMSHIITALESLQDTVRQFRTEVRELLETSCQVTTNANIVLVAEAEPAEAGGNREQEGEGANNLEEKKPTLVLVGGGQESCEGQSRPVQGGGQVHDDSIRLNIVQNEFRKQILDILNRRFIRATATAKGKKLVPKPRDVPTPKPITIAPIRKSLPSKNSKKMKPVTYEEDPFKKKLIVSIQRLDFRKYPNLRQAPEKNEVQSVQRSVKFREPITAVAMSSSMSSDYDEEDDWQSHFSVKDTDDNDDIDDFSDGTFDEPGVVIVPSTNDDYDEDSRSKSSISRVDIVENNKMRNNYLSECEEDKSGAEMSAYFDSSDFEEDDDLAPSKPKKKFNKKKVIGKYYCKHCERNFKTEFILGIHIKRRHEGVKNPFVCTEEGCTRAFRQKFLWEHHKNEHKGEKTANKYVCDTCGKSFSTSNSMHRHASSHTGKWKFPCTICDKGFHRPSELGIHLRKHADPKHKCLFCDEKFDKKHILVTHMVECHPHEDFKDRRTCGHCGKVFSGVDALKCHKIQIHQVGECKFKCDTCQKGYAKHSWLVRHQLTHSMQKTFTCDQCPEMFRFSASLRVHKMKHEGTYPHSCTFCDRKFILKQALDQHLSTHSKEKPFICEYCGKTYSNKFYLTLHVKRVHWEQIGLDERPKYLVTKSSRPRPKKPLESNKTKTSIKKNKKKRKPSSESSDDSDSEMILGNLDESEVEEGEVVGQKNESEVEEGEVVDQKKIIILEETIQSLAEDDGEETEEATQVIIQDEIETQRIETDPFIEFVVTHTDEK